MRVALGAGRSRLARQCLTESAMLGLGGGLLGVVLAFASVHPFVAFWPGTLPRAEEGGIGGLETPAAPSGTPGTPASFEPGTPAVPGSAGITTPGTRSKKGGTTVLGNRRGVLSQLEADLVGALISHRFDILYLSFTIAFIGLCLSSRLLVPRAHQSP